MKVYLTLEASIEVSDKLSVIADKSIEYFFEGKSYSSDLEYLYIAVFCMSPAFDSFFPPRKSKYTQETKQYTHHGVMLEKKAKTFEYELRLNFDFYNGASNVKPRLANDIINSLDNILLCKKIKNIELDLFKKDFRIILNDLGWKEE